MKTGICKFGATCRFHHPKDIQIPSYAQDNAKCEQIEIANKIGGASEDIIPALYLNTKGLPVRPVMCVGVCMHLFFFFN